MTDIVKRLRRQVIESPYEGFVSPLEAADEIERLRAALLKITKSVHGSFDDAHVMAEIARAALEANDE